MSHPAAVIPLNLSTHDDLLTAYYFLSTLFHSRINPITHYLTPSNLSTSIYLIRIRARRSNKHPVN
jgi:hypothetical protein